MALRKRLHAGLLVSLLCAVPWQARADIPVSVKQQLASGRITDAVQWLTQAAERNNAAAASKLGAIYYRGIGVEANMERATHYLSIGAEAGSAESMYLLACLHEKQTNAREAQRWYQRAADAGYERARSQLVATPQASSDGSLFDLITSGSSVPAQLTRDQSGQINSQGQTPLIRAILEGNTAWALALIDAGSEVDHPDHARNTALHYASRAGAVDLASALIAAGAAVDRTNAAGSTAAHLAVGHRRLAVVRLLAAANADFTVKDGAGWSVAMLAERSQDPALMVYGSKRAQRQTEGEATPAQVLHAVRTNNAARLRALADRGADLDAPVQGEVPLLLAAGLGHTASAHFLIGRGVDLAVIDDRGRNAAMLAASKGDDALLAALLHAGLNPNVADGKGRTALHHAVMAQCDACVLALLEAGADVSMRTQSGNTATILAAKRNDVKTGRHLLAFDGSVNARDRAGRSVLWWATAKHAGEFLVLALTRGATYRADADGKSPLHVAAEHPDPGIVASLLQHAPAAALAAATTDGTTPLMAAAALDHAGVVRQMLSSGANARAG